ncbi:MAG: tRNA (N6-isopentenyl adenosine(37)-C2)-methylthiotransferase MiaB [Fibrobacteraceae bacterium]|nr:tRNA (N6-isopentenyl adenosine(37)-C2)-methylthiotransferase MiaB [Fibrobacteraceae bacterium]
MKYHLATYGCQMNEYDSAMIAQMLMRHGATPVLEPDKADVIIVNTCSVREKAEDTAIARIFQFKPLKQANPDLKIIIVGCMAKNKGEELLKRLKFVNYVVGPDQYRKIPELLFSPSRKRLCLLDFDSQENYVGESANLLTPFSTHITIQRGCNKRCSYCIVPYVRGPEKYRCAEDILREVSEAARAGVSEVMLLGQTVNAYRDGNENFASLLNRVSEIEGIKRIRFTSPHPRHYTRDLLEVLTQNSKICHHAHIPLQSGSNAILKKMRRQHDMETYYGIIDYLRSADPLYHISTDIICGFVGETETDFEQTLEAVQKVQFDTAFMFVYSPRRGTESFLETEILSENEKKERHTRLTEIQNAITLKRNQLMLGRKETLLVERASSRDAEEMMGKTDNFKKVIFKPEGIVKPGDYVRCKIDDIRGWTLRGTLVENEQE